MASDKIRFLTPDGKPEMRTPDEMLRDAVSGQNFDDLPGKGKPIDLDEYFRPGEENRMAGKILRDNKVLPPQLQERKDAEAHLLEAEEELQKATEQITPLQEAIRPLAQFLTCKLTNDNDLLAVLNLDQLPSTFHASTELPVLYSVDVFELCEAFNRLCKRHNALVRNLTYRYLENLRIAHDNIKASQKRQLLNRSLLPTYAPTAPIDIEAKTKEIESRFAFLPELPDDWNIHLKKWQRTQRPSLWKRVVKPT